MSFKKLALTTSAILAALSMTGCSEQVPPGFKAKILGPDGYSNEVLTPGRHHVGFRESLILLDTSTNSNQVMLSAKTKDEMTIKMSIVIRGRIGGSSETLTGMFDDLRARGGMVDFQQVYNTYLKDAIMGSGRSILSQYNIQDINTNYDRISMQIKNAVLENAKSTPIQIDNVIIGAPVYPQKITDAIDLRKQRQIEIEQVEAQKQADIKRKEAELITTKKQAEIDIVKAQTLRDQNAIIAEGLSPILLEYRRLEVQEKMADKLGNSGSVVFYPYGDSGSTGLQNRIYQK